MGNQGHCDEGYRRLCEFVWAGVIGKITETHCWTDRANGGVGPRPPTLPVPAGHALGRVDRPGALPRFP